MSEPVSVKDKAVWKKADQLVSSVLSFSDGLPHTELYELKTRLKRCVCQVPEKLEDTFKQKSRIEKIRALIKANVCLEECRDYLSLVEKMQFGDTRDLQEKLDEISRMLTPNKVA